MALTKEPDRTSKKIMWEANNPVRNDHANSIFSWDQLPENTGQIFHLSRPPLNEYFCLKTLLQRSLLTSPEPRVAR